ncbi:MAG TPA: hypothetical protein EYH32_09885 [Anaerolineae bacterium]|nr:hypothetical protein [Anaerolineae bacterium]
MPCNAIATQTAHVNLNPALILDNSQAITAVQQLLAKLLDIQPQNITVYNDTHTWQAGWRQWSRNRTVQQPTPVEQLAGGQYIDWVCDKCAVRLHKNGQIELRDGWDLSRKHIANPNQFLDQVGAVFNQVTGLLFQQQVRATIAARYAIAEEQRAPNGALVLTVDL